MIARMNSAGANQRRPYFMPASLVNHARKSYEQKRGKKNNKNREREREKEREREIRTRLA